jgi:hypothetical protein
VGDPPGQHTKHNANPREKKPEPGEALRITSLHRIDDIAQGRKSGERNRAAHNRE